MKGLQDRMEFNSYLERTVTERLAEIEREDADRCAGCGGEDKFYRVLNNAERE